MLPTTIWLTESRGEQMAALGVEKASAAIEQDDISGEGLAGLSPEVAASVSGHSQTPNSREARIFFITRKPRVE